MPTYRQFGESLAHVNEVQGILQGWIQPDVGRLAAEYSEIVQGWKLGKEFLQHLSDTDVAMLQAWEKLTDTPYAAILNHYPPHVDLMNEAWRLAKLFNFRLRFEEGMNSEGDMVPAFGINMPDMFIVNAGITDQGAPVKPSFYGLTRKAVDALEQLNKDRDVL